MIVPRALDTIAGTRLIASDPSAWALFLIVPFEDRGLGFLQDLCASGVAALLDAQRIHVHRLQSTAKGLSLHELVKDAYERRISTICGGAGLKIDIGHPVKPDARALLHKLRDDSPDARKVAIDISAMPRGLVHHLCDELHKTDSGGLFRGYDEVLLVSTAAAEITAATGPGGSTAPTATCVGDPHLLAHKDAYEQIDLAIFPGYEGPEGVLAMDLASSPGTRTEILFDMRSLTPPSSFVFLHANTGLFEKVSAGKAGDRYYYSVEDAIEEGLAIAREAAHASNRASARRAFLVAPLAEKWTIAIASLMRAAYLQDRSGHGPLHADTILMSRNQDSTLHSTGHAESTILHYHLHARRSGR